jgi:hypothetical protein
MPGDDLSRQFGHRFLMGDRAGPPSSYPFPQAEIITKKTFNLAMRLTAGQATWGHGSTGPGP